MDDAKKDREEAGIAWLKNYFERVNYGAYVTLLQRPWYMIWLNFIGGLARGVGIGIGFTMLAALLVIILQKISVWNLPFIGAYIADIVRIVQAQLRTPTI
ncbi:DUF5665 domain-containing protein [Ferroacidibacillus organovorans]|uniref:Uncharacterized protein n=2 Tax=Ferroacidibacillus organovorans TaxID=1765683 RepID=A0A101XQE5_9BACL|nr:DUF5665 domain-containing protein [Ferroacidibacillus organovorans]KUO95574.1 hypothetical protein ATW55_06755 [Ferroacidibacillus organovorans]KYP81828.1 hypothetical protein AYJ22_05550 [Ferroacidibacillus organovorans]OAG94174.1 hypothetical protein AYW79_06580 [Ferroacidibacillus organovorans]OPG16204.1 hypothetical protein B2M26_07780 [Ferroacidibacillus organovorans]